MTQPEYPASYPSFPSYDAPLDSEGKSTQVAQILSLIETASAAAPNEPLFSLAQSETGVRLNTYDFYQMQQETARLETMVDINARLLAVGGLSHQIIDPQTKSQRNIDLRYWGGVSPKNPDQQIWGAAQFGDSLILMHSSAVQLLKQRHLYDETS